MILILILIILLMPVVRRILFMYAPKVPKFIYLKVIDAYRYIKYKKWKIFSGYGIRIWIGLFGKGKTLSLVETALYYAKKYPYLRIYSNIELKNFPYPERIYRLDNLYQIIDAPGNSIFIIDEISTLFQARQYKDFPMPLLSQMMQVRKRKKMILATAQIFEQVDKLIRDVTYTVTDCNLCYGRWQKNATYLAWEWEHRSPLIKPPVMEHECFLATDQLFNSYDTDELIDNLKKMQFLSSEQILERQGVQASTPIAVIENGKKYKKIK